jgi:hypothetical protein
MFAEVMFNVGMFFFPDEKFTHPTLSTRSVNDALGRLSCPQPNERRRGVGCAPDVGIAHPLHRLRGLWTLAPLPPFHPGWNRLLP